MSELNFHLKGIIHNRDETEDFNGPLDLVLMLLAKNKIEIRDIQISLILDQYIQHLSGLKDMDMEIASGFVQMASHLTYIKTKMLLTGDTEVTELQVLVSALEQQKNQEALAAVRENTANLQKRYEIGHRLHTRGAEPLPRMPYNVRHNMTELLTALAPVLLRGSGNQPKEMDLMRKAVPTPIIYAVREKCREIVHLLRERGTVGLKYLFSLCRTRSEIVATFLSVLDLCASGEVSVAETQGTYLLRPETGQENT